LPLSDAAPLEWRGPSRREWVARIQDGAERELLELRSPGVFRLCYVRAWDDPAWRKLNGIEHGPRKGGRKPA
jgi:hypothetical protein